MKSVLHAEKNIWNVKLSGKTRMPWGCVLLNWKQDFPWAKTSYSRLYGFMQSSFTSNLACRWPRIEGLVWYPNFWVLREHSDSTRSLQTAVPSELGGHLGWCCRQQDCIRSVSVDQVSDLTDRCLNCLIAFQAAYLLAKGLDLNQVSVVVSGPCRDLRTKEDINLFLLWFT